MQINIEKTETQRVGQIENELNINIKKQNLNLGKDFVYPVGNISGDRCLVRAGCRMLKEG